MNKIEKLDKICNMVLRVEEGLMCGTIDFYYDKLMCVLKPGHPMEILDDILAEIFWDVRSGKVPSDEQLAETLQHFKGFQDEFEVKEMDKPINALEEYLNPSKVYKFPIYLGNGGESEFEYSLTVIEANKIKKAEENGLDFEEAPGLIRLYKKLMKSAAEQLKEDENLTGENIDVSELDYSVGYPMLEE